MDVEKRIARLEHIVLEEGRIARMELKAVRIAAFLLLIMTLIAVVCWSLHELASLIIYLFNSLSNALGL